MSSGNIRGFSHNNEAFADILLFHIYENFHSKDGVINSFIIHEQVHTLVDLFLNRVSSNLRLVTSCGKIVLIVLFVSFFQEANPARRC